MVRDMKLVRKILLKVEECEKAEPLTDFVIDGYKLDVISYHCEMMRDIGLIMFDTEVIGTVKVNNLRVGPLTWRGHDYLEQIRNDDV